MLARRNNNEHLGTISYYRADGILFEAIELQFGFSEAATIVLMRRTLKRSSFNLWRKRVNSGVSQKHAQKRNPNITRFKCSLQKMISMNKISKR